MRPSPRSITLTRRKCTCSCVYTGQGTFRGKGVLPRWTVFPCLELSMDRSPALSLVHLAPLLSSLLECSPRPDVAAKWCDTVTFWGHRHMFEGGAQAAMPPVQQATSWHRPGRLALPCARASCVSCWTGGRTRGVNSWCHKRLSPAVYRPDILCEKHSVRE